MNALREANQYRSIRARCLPLFDLAHGIPEAWQESIYRTMVLHIAAALNIEATRQDLNLEPRWYPIDEDALELMRDDHDRSLIASLLVERAT